MDKIAVISDIHGNMQALEAVLADIRGRGIDLIYNLGDLVGKGANSDAVVDLCREVCQVVVQGNWDEFVSSSRQDVLPATHWYRDQLGPERLDYLRHLPYAHDFWLSGKRVRLFHASQESVYTRVYPSHPHETHVAMFDNTPATGDGPTPDIVGYGDIHSVYMLALYEEQKILFNAGSVGNPLDMPLASYVVLSGVLDSQTPGAFSVDFVRVPYDIEAALTEARHVNLPEYDAYAVELREAVYRGRQASG